MITTLELILKYLSKNLWDADVLYPELEIVHFSKTKTKNDQIEYKLNYSFPYTFIYLNITKNIIKCHLNKIKDMVNNT